MVSESYQRAKRIFLEAIDLPEGERERYLDRACAGDDSLRSNVSALIAADGENDSALDGHATDLVSIDADNVELEELVCVGPYRLQQKIGEGGMGEVWLASQVEPMKRQVALKVIKQGMDSKQVVARFKAEKQALASMDHSAIAKVYDAGTTDGGRPYIAMEYIRGVKITEYCDQQKLTNRDRLRLFIEVCEAVQHAHQNALIHRDLKPSNVMITSQGDQPMPKIIDFGVAKATGPELSDETVLTQQGVLVGTPVYMSPEQADLQSHGIDTRTDVYSLGVMLYELLVGALPFDATELQQGGLERMLRRIRTEEPSRPSAKLSTLGDQSTDSARRRQTELQALRRELTGDLDWITLKAMAKKRSERYSSPQELAADIQRYLNDEPVLATPPSFPYLARKFVRRHTVGVGVALASILVVVAFAVLATIYAGRLADERDRANREAASKTEVADFLAKLFTSSQPSNARGQELTARQLLDAGSQQIEQLDDELTRTDLAETISEVYMRLGLYTESEALLVPAIADRRRLSGDAAPETLKATDILAKLYYSQGRYDESEELFAEALQTATSSFGTDHPITLRAQTGLGLLASLRGDYERAASMHAEVLDLQERALGNSHADTLISMKYLASNYRRLARYDEAEAIHLRSLDAERRSLGADHPSTLGTMRLLADLYKQLGRNEEAEQMLDETIAVQLRVLGPEHSHTLASYNLLGLVYIEQGRFEEAEQLFTTNLEASRRVRGDEHVDTLLVMGNLALAYKRLERFEEAAGVYEETLAIQERTLGVGHADTAIALFQLANIYRDTGRFTRSASFYERAIEVDSNALGPQHPYVADDFDEYAQLRRKMGDEAAAIELEARAKSIRDAR